MDFPLIHSAFFLECCFDCAMHWLSIWPCHDFQKFSEYAFNLYFTQSSFSLAMSPVKPSPVFGAMPCNTHKSYRKQYIFRRFHSSKTSRLSISVNILSNSYPTMPHLFRNLFLFNAVAFLSLFSLSSFISVFFISFGNSDSNSLQSIEKEIRCPFSWPLSGFLIVPLNLIDDS